MPEQWVVLLEAAGDGARDPIEADDLNRLHEALEPGRCGGVLHSPDRYALQVTATGAGPLDALLDVVARWADGVRRLGIPAWKLVRTEVFTPEDLERELESAEHEAIGIQPPDAESGPNHDEDGHDLLHRAFSDPLTGLLGRHAFEYRLEPVLGGRRPVAIITVGLDAFQGVNERFGGGVADEALIAVGGRLVALLRPGDILARLGGDEYGVLLEDITEEGAFAVAERMLHAVSLPMVVAGQDLILSASAGVVVGQPGESAEAVLANAGAALDGAKAAGGGRAVLYRSEVSSPGRPRQHFVPAALQDRLAQLQLMQQAAMTGNEAESLHQAARVVMRHICAQVGCAVGHLWISPTVFGEMPQTPLWHLPEGGHDPALQEAAEELLAGPGGLAPVVAGGRPVWIKDLHDNDDALAHGQATAAGLRSAFAFPVLVGPDVVAVLAFFSRTAMEPADSFLEVLLGIGAQLARVVERQRAAEDLRRAAEQVRASEVRLREAETLTRLGSWQFDLRTGAATWSDGTGALYGMDPRHPLDLHSALAAVHAEDRPRTETALLLLVENGASFADEIRVIRPDGQVRWHRAQGSAIRDDNGVVVGLRGMSQDITEQKRAEQELQRTKDLYQRIVETTCEGILILDAQDIITFVNPRMAQILGYSVDTMAGMPASALVDEETGTHLSGHQRLRREGMSEHYEIQLLTKDGAVLHVLVSANPFIDDDGHYVGALALVTDVTTLREAEEIMRSHEAGLQTGVDEEGRDEQAAS